MLKTGEALPGVNVIIKGTYYGAATDINGNLELIIFLLELIMLIFH